MAIVAIEASFIIMGSLLMIPAVSPVPMRILTRRWYPQRRVARIHLGLRTRWFITGFFVLALIMNSGISYWFLGFAAYLAIKEYVTTMPTRRADRRLIFVIYMLIPLQLLFMANQLDHLSMLFLPVFALIGLPTLMRSTAKQNFYDALMLMQWGILATMWSLCVPIIMWKDNLQTQPLIVGIMLMFFLLGLSQLNKLLRRNVFLRGIRSHV